MVFPTSGTISEGQVLADTVQSYSTLIIDTSGNVSNVATYTYGTITSAPINANTAFSAGNAPPPGEYAILLSPSTTVTNSYISFTSTITSLNITLSTAYNTFECWVYPTAYNTAGSIIFGKCVPTSSTLDWQLNISAAGYLTLIYNTTGSGTQTVTTGFKIPLNSWSHVAVCFYLTNPLSTFYICANGAIYSVALVGTMSASSTGNYLTIGQYNNTTLLIGYISCLRVLTSTTVAAAALYTTGGGAGSTGYYSIPTVPLTKSTTANITTALILRSNPKFIQDACGIIANIYSASVLYGAVTYINTPASYGSLSTTSGVVNVGGAITVGNIASAPPKVDGAIFFNGAGGTGSYISNTNAAYTFNWWQGGGFTLELWANFISFPAGVTPGTGVPTLVGNMSPTTTTTNGWAFGPNANGQLVFWYFNGSGAVFATSTNNLLPNTWYHIALTSDGTNIYMLVNGVSFYTTAISGTPTAITSNFFTVGQYNAANPINCYISNLRIIKSGAPLYTTATFTPSTTPLAISTTGTTVVLLRASPPIIDITRTLTTVSTASTQVLYGGIVGTYNTITNGSPPPAGDGVIYLPNSSTSISNYLSSSAASLLFSWWSTGVTCEMWVNYQSFTNVNYNNGGSVYSPALIGAMNPSTSADYWSFGAISTGALSFYYFNGAGNSINTTQTLSLNTWYHIAFSYSGSGNFIIFINGVIAGSGTISGTPQIASPFTLGTYYTNYYVNAYISNVRLVNGAALYTAPFIVPTQPLGLSATGTTVLLLRVPPIEVPLSQMSLAKTYVGRYRGNVNSSQGPIPGYIILANVYGVNLGYTAGSGVGSGGSGLPIFDTQVTNSIIFNNTSSLILPTITFTPYYGFSIVATISLSSSILTGTTLFMIADTTAYANYFSITYPVFNTLSFNICNTGSVSTVSVSTLNVPASSSSPNTIYSIVLTYSLGTLNIYINNSLINNGNSTVSPLIIPQTVLYSNNYINSGAAFNCYNFAVYNRNFTANDVATYYSNSLISNLPTVSQLPMGPIIDLAYPMNEIISINPQQVTITTPSATSIQVTFTGTAFVTATLYYYGTDGKTGTYTGLTSGSSTTLSSLTANTLYVIEIIPFNSSGISSVSGTYTASITTAAYVTGLYSAYTTTTSTVVYWAASGNGSAYSYITISASPAITGIPTTITGGGTSYILNNLASSTAYTITVTPYNSAGIAGIPATVNVTALYNYTSYTFTSAGVNGYIGPTLAKVQAYGLTEIGGGIWTQNTALLNVTSGFQYWTVPQTGTYIIVAAGAGTMNWTGYNAGRGVVVSNTYTLTQGTVIKILVGQMGNLGTLGGGSTYAYTGAAGGGTYVYNNTASSIVLIAGGGGSPYFPGITNAVSTATSDGVLTTTAANGTGGGTGGSGGNGGTSNQSGDQNAGAGFNSGTAGNSNGGTVGGTEAQSFLNGGTGAGNATYSGGFGGGGISSGSTGWGGGGASYDSANSGGAYAATQYTAYCNGGYNSGPGFAIIALVSAISTYTTPPSFNATTNLTTYTVTLNWNLPTPTISSAGTQTLIINAASILVTPPTPPTLTYTSTSTTIVGLTAGVSYFVTLVISNPGYMDYYLTTTFKTPPVITSASAGTATPTTIPISFSGYFDFVVVSWTYSGGSGSSGNIFAGTTYNPTLTTTYSPTLSGSTTYTFTVTPYTMGGAGGTTTAGTSYNVGTYSTTVLAGAVSNIQASGITTSQMVLSWTAGSGASSYQITSSPATNTQTASASGYTFAGLAAGTAYTFTIVSLNAQGQGGGSTTSGSFTTTSIILYTFTSFIFTTAGANTTTTGPTLAQMQSYGNTASGGGSWTQNTSYLNCCKFSSGTPTTGSTGGIWVWTVPQTRNYKIIAAGAAAGSSPQGGVGAGGIIISNVVALTSGQIVYILCGSMGQFSGNGGGGGGTYVATYSGGVYIALLVAGGGGGGSNGVYGGGASLTVGSQSNSGAGFATNTNNSYGATAFLNGGTGGSGGGGGFGGFGGGGSATGGFPAGGGGGGYYGGYLYGSGGSCYDINGASNTATQYTTTVNGQSGGNNTGQGFVVITAQ